EFPCLKETSIPAEDDRDQVRFALILALNHVLFTITMARMDREQEQQRLTDLYSHMTDDELQKIGEDLASLTGVARQALTAEAGHRGITMLSNTRLVAEHEPELRNLVTIRQFRDLPEALLARGSLDSAGIECFLTDDNMVRMDWFIS